MAVTLALTAMTEQEDPEDRLIHLHRQIGKEGAILEIRPKGQDYPSESDMAHLNVNEIRGLRDDLNDFLTEVEAEQKRQEERIAEAFEDVVTALPLPPQHKLDVAKCHNCGEPWNDGEDWEERHLHGGPSVGETWKYECPGCGHETFEVGT